MVAENRKFIFDTTELPNDYVWMSVGHLVHVLLTVYNATEHVTQKSPGPVASIPISISKWRNWAMVNWGGGTKKQQH